VLAQDGFLGQLGALVPLPPAVQFVSQPDASGDMAHVFVTQWEELAKVLGLLRQQFKPGAVLWVSWLKKAA
jgi:hypothetical protein